MCSHTESRGSLGNYCLLRLKDKAERLRRANNSYMCCQIVTLDVSNCMTEQKEPFLCSFLLGVMKTHLDFISVKTETPTSESSRTTKICFSVFKWKKILEVDFRVSGALKWHPCGAALNRCVFVLSLCPKTDHISTTTVKITTSQKH